MARAPPLPSLSSSPSSSSASILQQQQQQQQQMDLELTIVSAKHLKNVNWRNGDLKPYAVFWIHPDRKLSTKTDDSGSTRPVWNEKFTIAIPSPSLHDSFFTLDIFHTKGPIIASLRCPLTNLLSHPHPDDDHHHRPIKILQLLRPSGRPQGKIRVKASLRERPPPPLPPHPHPHPHPHLDFHIVAPPPPSSYYYSTAPPPPPPPSSSPSSREYCFTTTPPYGSPQPSHYPYAAGYADPYSGYYPTGYYSPPPPPRPFFDRASGYGGSGGPSAPVDYSAPSASLYEQKPKGAKMGMGAGLAVGALAGAMGGLALEEGLKYEEEKTAERVRDDYSDYRADY